ncbi:mechanosensitive ion channel family protein [Olivibacter sitiensis]|uniref:mechanosensitive ion channel family protein n=1 Tax=Olivibacter sitiensis TaxID=376470 RepID=UPI000688E037|nr:mechanosensitive ion channel family protein [Olivibacter sitiensis]
MDSIHRADSLKQGALQQELERLKTTDNLKKVELLEEMNSLRNQEKIRNESRKARIDSMRNKVRGYAVAPYYDTLFLVYSKLGPYSPQQRAATASARIKEIAEDYGFTADSILLVSTDESVDLTYRNEILLSVTDLDAIWANADKQSLAAEYRQRIIKSVEKHIEENKLGNIVKNILAALLVIFVFFLVVNGMNILFRRLKMSVLQGKNKWYHGIKIRSYELFSVRRQASLFLTVINLIKWLFIITALYLSLLSLFSVLPWTKPIADRLLDYFLSPLRIIGISAWHYLPNLVTIFVILLVFRYVLRLIRYFRDEVQRGALVIPGFYPEWAAPTYHIIRILAFAFIVVVVYPYLPNSDSPVFKGVSVFLGFLLTFGSAGSLSNVIAGLVLTYTRSFQVGDRVKIGETIGDITEKNLLVTRVRTINNEDVTIPNATVMGNHVVNYSSSSKTLGLCLSTAVTVRYNVPWKKVVELLETAAKRTPGILPLPQPYVLQRELGNTGVVYELNAYTNSADRQFTLHSSLRANIQDVFFEAGIDLTTPVVLSQGNERTN